MRLEIERHLLLLPLVRKDGPYEEHQPVRRYPVIELQSLLRRRDGGEHGESVHTGFDVRGGPVFLRQHVGELRDLRLFFPSRRSVEEQEDESRRGKVSGERGGLGLTTFIPISQLMFRRYGTDLGRDDQTDHTRTGTTGRVQLFDQLSGLP